MLDVWKLHRAAWKLTNAIAGFLLLPFTGPQPVCALLEAKRVPAELEWLFDAACTFVGVRITNLVVGGWLIILVYPSS